MPEKSTLKHAREDAREGKSPGTQAGEFVREEMHHVRKGKHGARSSKQAIAIGLSKARRAGVKLRAPSKGKASTKTRTQASRDLRTPSSRQARAVWPTLARNHRRSEARGTWRSLAKIVGPASAKHCPRPRTSRTSSCSYEGRSHAHLIDKIAVLGWPIAPVQSCR